MIRWMYDEDAPSRQELAWEEEQDRLEREVCEECGERLRYCMCVPEDSGTLL